MIVKKIISVFLVFYLFSFAAMAGNATVQTFEDWHVICPPLNEGHKTPACHLSQSIKSKDGKAVLMLATITKHKKDSLAMILTAPLGIDLGAGLKWQVDRSTSKKFIFNTCTHEGCFAAVPLNASLLRSMKKGNVVKIEYRDGGANKIKIDLSLKGFTAGTSALIESAQ